MTIYRLTKISVAIDQLDWAIRLLTDHRAYVPAIALAGAADEILGSFIGKRASFHVLKSTLAAEHGLPEKQVADEHLNNRRNWFKHCGPDDHANTSIELYKEDLEADCIQIIVRALHNLVVFDSSGPSNLPRFIEWLKETRPDLLCNLQSSRIVDKPFG